MTHQSVMSHDTESTAVLAGKPFLAQFQPEYWDANDYAVPAGPQTDFDISDQLVDMDEDDREELLDGAESGSLGYIEDELFETALGRAKAERWDGPYTVSIDADKLRDWLAANPPWTNGGDVPHPTGGYTRFETVQMPSGTTTSFLDAQGRLHREDGPAHIDEPRSNGASPRLTWCEHGVITRDGGPAITGNGPTEWRKDGELHRLDGPAYVDLGVEEYHVHGVLVGRRELVMKPGWKLDERGHVVHDVD